MNTFLTSSRARAALLAVFFAGSALACVDGPFARVNPNDEKFEGTIEIRASRDTISPSNPVVVLHIVTDPVVAGYEPRWSLPSGSGLTHMGHGVFELSTLPLTVAPVEITARFEDQERTITIYKAPTP